MKVAKYIQYQYVVNANVHYYESSIIDLYFKNVFAPNYPLTQWTV